MSKKQDSKKSRKSEIQLTQEETSELEMILDRLSVQSPDGQSLEGYVKSLHKALIGREDLVAALIERLAKNPSEVGFRIFSGLIDLVENKKYGRIAKQALYRFQQRGLGTPPEKSGEQRVVLVQSKSRESLAHFTPQPEAFWLISAIVDEPGYAKPLVLTAYPEEGFRRLSVKISESSHHLYRKYMQKASSRLSRSPCEIPVWHMARLFWDLSKLCEGREQTGDVEQAKRLLRSHYKPERPPYVYELMPALDNAEELVREIDPNILLKNVAYPWLAFSKEELLPYWQRVREVRASILVVSPEIQEERSRNILGNAADELCIGKSRFLWQRFFEEEAMWLKLSAKEDLAMVAWVTAQHLASGAKPSENPVCLKIIAASMMYYWPEEFETRKNQTDPFCHTDSGLIVPC